MSSAGPTQGENRVSGKWANRPFLAGALRFTVMAAPTIASFMATRLFTKSYPADSVAFSIILWWLIVITIGITVLVGADRVMRRALPLVALFKLSLIFPDKAPSRFSVAMRTGTTKQLERQIEDIKANGVSNDSTKHAQRMLQMVAALSVHDRLTRGHCERVRAYTDMIAEEMNLDELSAAKLRWAALLHDVGKLFVPAEILNKEGRPTDAEWEILKSHTWQGDKLVGPLKPWLGEWAAAVGSHHERWDGDGYPDGLKGEEIHIGARIVSVADTFDVITSKRSYKEPITADNARSEIARCAGTQFDPRVARAFLNIGLGRLRFAIGPLSWLANLPAAGQAAVAPVASPIATAVVALAATGAAVISGNSEMFFAQNSQPEQIAFIEETEEVIVELPVETTTTTFLVTTTVEPTTTTLEPTTTIQTTTTVKPATTIQQTTTIRPTTTIQPTTTTTAPPLAPPEAQNVTVSLSEDAPTIVSIPVQTSTGDLTLRITSQGSQGQATVTNNVATAVYGVMTTATIEVAYQPNPNANGTDTFAYEVCDQAGLCVTGTASVTIAAVNDRPTMAPLANLASQAGQPVSIQPIASDPEGDSLTFAITGLPSGLVYNVATGAISGTITAGLPSGPRSVVVTATDSGSPAMTASRTMTLTIVDAAAPVALAANQAATEDAPVTVRLDATTYDGNLTFRITTPPTKGSLGPIGTPSSAPRSTETTVSALVNYTPNANANGADSFGFEVCDFLARCDTAIASLTIGAVNDAPTLAPIADQSTAIGAPLNVTLTVADIDAGDTVAATVVGLPAGVTYDDGTRTISGVIQDGFAGSSHIITVTATDNGSPALQATRTFTIDVPAAAPVALAASATSPEDTTATIALLADTETGNLTYSIPTGQPFTGTASFATATTAAATYGWQSQVSNDLTYTPAPDSNGPVSISYMVCDVDGACSTATLSLTVAPVNDAPVVTASTASMNEDTTLTIADTAILTNASDIDDVTLFATWRAAPSGTLIDSGSSMDFTPDPNFNGTLTLSYDVCDPAGACTTGDLNLTVDPTNDAPSFSGFADRTYNIDDVVSITSSATDIDGDTLVFSATDLPLGLSINPATGLISGTVADGQPKAEYEPIISVNDGTVTVNRTFNITVVPKYPVISGGSYTATEDTAKVFNFTGTTQVGTLQFSIIVPPVNGTVSALTPTTAVIPPLWKTTFFGNLTYTPNLNYSGPDSITLRICDVATGTYCADAIMSVTVSPVNDAPVLGAIADQPIAGGAAFTTTATATDVEGNTLTFSSPNLPAGLTINGATGVISGTPALGNEGTRVTSTIVVTDNGTPTRTASTAVNFDFSVFALAPEAGALVISEVGYQTSATLILDEYIELYNDGASPIDLTALTLADYEVIGEAPDPSVLGFPGSFNFAFPATDIHGNPATLAPGQYAVVWIVDPLVGGLSATPFPYTTTATDLEFTVDLVNTVLAGTGDEIWLTRADTVVAYAAWGTFDGGASNDLGVAPPAVLNIWDSTHQDGLKGAATGTSISAADPTSFSESRCWEATTSGAAVGNGCIGALPTLDTDPGVAVRSPGVPNVL